MLRVYNVSLFRGVKSFNVFEHARSLSSKKKVVDVLIKDPTMMAARFISLFKDEDITAKVAAMGELRDDPSIEKLGKLLKASDSHSNWFKQFIENSLNGKNDDLYPRRIPVDKSEALDKQKAILASALYSIKNVDKPQLIQTCKMDIDASEIADDVGDLIQLHRLVKVNTALKKHVESQDLKLLKKNLAAALGFFLDESSRIYAYLDLPITAEERKACREKRDERLMAISKLSDSIEFLHLNNATRVGIEKARKEAEKDALNDTISDGIIMTGKNKGKTHLKRHGDHYCFELPLRCISEGDTSKTKLLAVSEKLDKHTTDGREKPIPAVHKYVESPFAVSLLDDRSNGGDSSECLASIIPEIVVPDEQILRRVMLTNIRGGGAWGPDPEERIRSALSRLGEVSDVWVFDEEESEKVDLVTFVVPSTQRTKKEKIRDKLEKERWDKIMIEEDILDNLPPLKNGNRPTRIPADMLPKHLQKKKETKSSKIMLEDKTTDSYAFVEMATDEGYRNVTRQFVRLFGIYVDRQPVSVVPAVQMTSFLVQVGDLQDVGTVLERLNHFFADQFQVLMTKQKSTSVKPLFVKLEFDSHSDGWKAFTQLHAEWRKGSRNGSASLRPMWRPTEWHRELNEKIRIMKNPLIEVVRPEDLESLKQKEVERIKQKLALRRLEESLIEKKAAAKKGSKEKLRLQMERRQLLTNMLHELKAESMLAIHQQNYSSLLTDEKEEGELEDEDEDDDGGDHLPGDASPHDHNEEDDEEEVHDGDEEDGERDEEVLKDVLDDGDDDEDEDDDEVEDHKGSTLR